MAHTCHVSGTRGDHQRSGPGIRDQSEARIVLRKAGRADDISRRLPIRGAQDVALFVPVGIGEQAALLHPHKAEILDRIEGLSRNITGHGRPPNSCK
ncbi:hypothetical protein D3C71_1852630 [compost metagenome]